jgi:cell fate regulator YaaT (PSP1 superfamily)
MNSESNENTEQRQRSGGGGGGGRRRGRPRIERDSREPRREQEGHDGADDHLDDQDDQTPLIGPIAHIAFRGKRLEAFHNNNNLDLRVGDYVIVEAERGVDLGWVTICRGPDLKRRRNQPLRKLQRHATREEIERIPILRKEDQDALDICRDRAVKFSLEMKVIDAETQFDGNRVTFYFTAEHRVDFRELVRDLASIFRTRIELRQVGARDAARRCDGIGPCGRQLCCTTCLREFEPVTLRMAKEQQLSLNPAKISGSCGRLMCCLVYECGAYQTANKMAPKVGTQWRYQGRVWRVDSLDLGNNRLFLRDGEEENIAVDLIEFGTEAEAMASHPEQRGGAGRGKPPEATAEDSGND